MAKEHIELEVDPSAVSGDPVLQDYFHSDGRAKKPHEMFPRQGDNTIISISLPLRTIEEDSFDSDNQSTLFHNKKKRLATGGGIVFASLTLAACGGSAIHQSAETPQSNSQQSGDTSPSPSSSTLKGDLTGTGGNDSGTVDTSHAHPSMTPEAGKDASSSQRESATPASTDKSTEASKNHVESPVSFELNPGWEIESTQKDDNGAFTTELSDKKSTITINVKKAEKDNQSLDEYVKDTLVPKYQTDYIAHAVFSNQKIGPYDAMEIDAVDANQNARVADYAIANDPNGESYLVSIALDIKDSNNQPHAVIQSAKDQFKKATETFSFKEGGNQTQTRGESLVSSSASPRGEIQQPSVENKDEDLYHTPYFNIKLADGWVPDPQEPPHDGIVVFVGPVEEDGTISTMRFFVKDKPEQYTINDSMTELKAYGTQMQGGEQAFFFKEDVKIGEYNAKSMTINPISQEHQQREIRTTVVDTPTGKKEIEAWLISADNMAVLDNDRPKFDLMCQSFELPQK